MPTFMLFIWPVVAIAIFAALGRERGLIWSVVVGFLFLPEAWILNAPGIPPFGKIQSIALGVLLGVLATLGKAVPLPAADRWAKAVLSSLVVLLFLTPFVTMLTNPDGFMRGPVWFPPVRLVDVRADIFASLSGIVPFLFARRLLHDPRMHHEILKAIVFMAFFYSLFVLFEARMSPQLNVMVYGYFPHSFQQHIRGGAWRPLVFLSHALELGFYLLTAVLAAIALFRSTREDSRVVYFVGAIALFAVLLISNNTGALMICLTFLPVATLMTPKTHVRIALVVAVLFATYSLVRDVYIEPLLDLALAMNESRHQSLNFRFINEDMLINRAAERPVAGWGAFARWHVHDDRGQPLTVSDGLWIIQLGQRGWMGFIGLFGLVIAPLFLLRRAARSGQMNLVTSVLVLMVAANLIYMIPNATLSPVGWMVAGALAGYAQFARAADAADGAGNAADSEADVLASCGQSRYTRFASKHQRAAPVKRTRYSRRDV